MEPNQSFVEDVSHTTWLYLTQGSGIEIIADYQLEVFAGNGYDLSSYLGKTVNHTSGNDGVAWVGINPTKPGNANIQVIKIETSNPTQTITIDKPSTIFTIVEGITINGVATKLNNIINVPVGKVLSFAGQLGGVCAVYTPTE
jgi:hypothetical protein